MKRIKIVAILLVLILGVFSACSNKEFVIKGQFSGVDFQNVSLVPMEDYKVLATSEIDKDGNFEISISGIKEGEYVLKFIDNEKIPVYISKSGTLSLDISYSNYMFDVKYEGDNANESTFIYRVREKQGDIISRFYASMMSIDIKELDKAFINLSNELKSVLDANMTENENLSNVYDSLIVYQIANAKLQYETLKRSLTETGNYVLPHGFNDYKKSIQLNNFELVEYREYVEFVRVFFRIDIINQLYMDKGKYTVSEYIESYLAGFKEKVVPTRVKNLVIYTGFKRFMCDLVREDADATIKIGMKNLTNKKFRKDIDSIFKRLKSIEYKLSPGSVPPMWEAKDVNGKLVSLESLKGHYVFVDVWATWCAPCVQELPYLTTLAGKYRSKNVIFVSISIDSNFDEWKKYISARNNEVIQLVELESFKSDFVKDYEINAIPRYMLFDQLGKVVNSRMPRPSDPKVQEILDSVL